MIFTERAEKTQYRSNNIAGEPEIGLPAKRFFVLVSAAFATRRKTRIYVLLKAGKWRIII